MKSDFDNTVLFINRLLSPAAKDEERTAHVVNIGYMGIAGRVDVDAVRHFRDMENPHSDGITNVRARMDDVELWPYVNGEKLALHQRPIFYDDIDWPTVKDHTVKTNEHDSTERFLSGAVTGLIRHNETLHNIFLAGDEHGESPKNSYFGTDKFGRLGWHMYSWVAR